ncbi:MAG: bifunctional 5,10-methylenetetrahydrofolate dehydrogenase/5,10-methenyltetrahydrofolate cyclohydrolase [Oscillospiraceae bacterium]|nr:bifunctional 5,10-methylenetetrahydrofolate dehydrogenase/5,10-methenyltetrahydrofolate cyclohydrolase [Oscillospiraceae bacterium]
MAILLKGAEPAEKITAELRERTAALRARGVKPCLAIVRVGARADDLAYERAAAKRCAAAGIELRSAALPESIAQGELIEKIEELNADAEVHGVLLLRPLPKTLDEAAACAALAPQKDVDGITAVSMASLYSGAGEGYPPCTAEASVRLLKHYNIPLEGARAAVVGRSLVIGRPVALLLLAENATVTLCHSRTKALAEETSRADILIAAAGSAGIIGAEHVRAGQAVVDVGINTAPDGSLCGDVCFDECSGIVGAISPVPGGVGALTTAVLAEHVVSAAERATA